MRINAIRDGTADVTLDAGELVCLGNVLHFYEKHWDANSGFSAPGQTFHAVAKQIVTARDIAQYGRMDGHSLSLAVTHELAMHPNGQLIKKLGNLIEIQAEIQAENQGRMPEPPGDCADSEDNA